MRHVVLVIALMSAVSCGGEGGGSPGSPSTTPPAPAARKRGRCRARGHTQYVVLVRSVSNGGGSPPGGTTEFTLAVTRPN
jgi:hypothetical protein